MKPVRYKTAERIKKQAAPEELPDHVLFRLLMHPPDIRKLASLQRRLKTVLFRTQIPIAQSLFNNLHQGHKNFR